VHLYPAFGSFHWQIPKSESVEYFFSMMRSEHHTGMHSFHNILISKSALVFLEQLQGKTPFLISHCIHDADSSIYPCWMACADQKHKENHPSSRCLGGWTPYESMTMCQLLSSPCIVHRTLPLPILGPALSPSQSILTFLYLLPLTGSSCSIVAYMQTHVLECSDWLDRVIHVKWKVIIESMNFCSGTLEFLHQCCSLIL